MTKTNKTAAVKTTTTNKVETMTTKDERTQRVSRAIVPKMETTIVVMQIGDMKAFEKWIGDNFPEIADSVRLVVDRTDGRYVATCNVPYTTQIALRLMRLNSNNRKFRPHHAQLFAEKFREPADDQNGFDDDISTLSVFFSYDPASGELLLVATADGQHRSAGKVGADGTAVEYHEMMHYLATHAANLDKDAADMRSLDWVEVKHETDYTDPRDGKVKRGAFIPLDQWRELVESAVSRKDAGKTDLATLTNGRDLFTNWTLREDLAGEKPAIREPFVHLLIGTHPRTLAKHDQNNLARSGADELDLSTVTGPLLRKAELSSDIAATWVRNHYLRIKPHTETTLEDGSTEMRRGDLGDGGKSIAPASYPSYFLSPCIQPRILAAWEQWNRIAKIVALWSAENVTTPKHAKHAAYEIADYARRPAGWEKKSRTRTGGYMIPDHIVRLCAGLIERLDKTEPEYADELADFIHRAAYGVAVKMSEGKPDRYIPDGVFEDVRAWIMDRKEDAGNFKANDLVDQIATAWNAYKKTKTDSPDRFTGLDTNGMSENDLKAIKAAQRGAEYIPGRKRGRPAVGIGNGTKKKPRKVS